eukprot:2801006-Pyramimonas_sp.AAC.1
MAQGVESAPRLAGLRGRISSRQGRRAGLGGAGGGSVSNPPPCPHARGSLATAPLRWMWRSTN